MTTTVILDRVEKTLLDEANVQWTRAELLDYLNGVLRYILLLNPEAYVVQAATALTASSSKQVLPATANGLVGCFRNMGSGGTTPGPVITKVEMNHMDRIDLDWHTTTGSAVKHYMYDYKHRNVFWVYPSVTGTWYVDLAYAAIPTARDEAEANDILIGDEYETPLYYGILAFAYAKNAKRGDATKRTDYITEFFKSLGIASDAIAKMAPFPQETNGSV